MRAGQMRHGRPPWGAMPRAHRPGRWLSVAVGGPLVAGAVLAAWGLLVEPRVVQTTRITARVPELPPVWEGQHIALLADLQIGAPLANTDAVRRAIRRVVESGPAAVLLAGDFVYRVADEPHAILAELRNLLQPLIATRIPIFAVLGNHDFAIESSTESVRQRAFADLVASTLERAGIRLLRNQAAPIPLPASAAGADCGLYVVGLGERAVGEDDWRVAFRQVPQGAARIVLTHDPATFEHIPPGWAPLALAGHTHAGQIRVPFKPEWTPARLMMRWPEYLAGWIDGFGQAGNHLYVNRGIGFSLLPVRIGAPPEVTLVSLIRPRTTPPPRQPRVVRCAAPERSSASAPPTDAGAGLRGSPESRGWRS